MEWEKSMRGARYHEAGHAVAVYHHGWTIKEVTVTDEVWWTGFQRPLANGYADAWRQACVTMAGQLADERASWGEMRPESWENFRENAEVVRMEVECGDELARDDHLELLEHLEEMASYPGMGSLEDCYREVVEDSRRLVTEHWAEVEALASALERLGTLSGEAAVEIIERTSRQSA
jgi:hypothetical protein